LALARQICMYILREELGYKLEKIAEILNRKDHTTVIHAIDKIDSMKRVDESFRDQMEVIMNNLHSI